MQKAITVIAAGGAGCRIMTKLKTMPQSSVLNLKAIDTDRQDLIASTLPASDTILAAEAWRRGKGCGGSIIDGQRAIASARSAIRTMLKDSELIFVIGGLGGGTATSGIPIILSEASALHIPTICIISMPFFSLESKVKSMTAEKALHEDIFPTADGVLALPNDLLFAAIAPETPIEEAFQLADQEFARTVLALSAILTGGNLFSTKLSDFCAILNKQKNTCAIGIGRATADTPDKIEKALGAMLNSPLLGGLDRISEADAVIFSVLGDASLSIGDAKNALECGKKLIPENAIFMSGAATSQHWENFLQLSIVAIKFDERDAARTVLSSEDTASLLPDMNTSKNTPVAPAQLDLPLGDTDKGIMQGTVAVTFNGMDLDIPTYIRRNLALTGAKQVK